MTSWREEPVRLHTTFTDNSPSKARQRGRGPLAFLHERIKLFSAIQALQTHHEARPHPCRRSRTAGANHRLCLVSWVHSLLRRGGARLSARCVERLGAAFRPHDHCLGHRRQFHTSLRFRCRDRIPTAGNGRTFEGANLHEGRMVWRDEKHWLLSNNPSLPRLPSHRGLFVAKPTRIDSVGQAQLDLHNLPQLDT